MSAVGPGTDGRRIRVLWNPTSGRKGGIRTNRASREMLIEVLARHGLGDELVAPGSEQEMVEAARDAVVRGYDIVVAAGGDGTIGLVGRQLLGSRTALGVLPFGSVMNIPRMLGVPRDPDAAAQIIAAGNVRTIDVGRVGDRIFYEAGSIGLHAAATREMPLVDRGDYGAIARSIWAAIRYRPTEVIISLDEERSVTALAVGVVVANGPYLGPGVAVVPDARLDDGLFDIRVILPYTWSESLAYVRQTLRGRRPRARRSIDERARRVRVASERPLAARADAVDLGSTPVQFELVPGVLRVVAPEPAASPGGPGPHLPHISGPGRVPPAGPGLPSRNDVPSHGQQQQP